MHRADLAWLTARPIAHRGYHDAAAGRIENSPAAFAAAAARGFTIECDLQPTTDGEALVFHDDTLDRLAEATGPVAALPLAELRRLRLKGSGEAPPSLADLLELVGGRVPLLIELKAAPGSDRRMEARVAEQLARYPGKAAVMSFDPGAVAAMRRLAPAIPRGLTADRFLAEEWPGMDAARRFARRHLLAAPAVGAAFVSYDLAALTDPAPRLFRRLGGPLIAWTVRTPADRAKAARHADQITFEGFDPDAP